MNNKTTRLLFGAIFLMMLNLTSTNMVMAQIGAGGCDSTCYTPQAQPQSQACASQQEYQTVPCGGGQSGAKRQSRSPLTCDGVVVSGQTWLDVSNNCVIGPPKCGYVAWERNPVKIGEQVRFTWACFGFTTVVVNCPATGDVGPTSTVGSNSIYVPPSNNLNITCTINTTGPVTSSSDTLMVRCTAPYSMVGGLCI